MFARACTLLERTRPTSWFALILAIALYGAAILVCNFAHSGFIGGIIDDLERATNGWVAIQLAYPLISLCLVSLAVFGAGNLRPADLGWRTEAIFPALAVTAFFWICVQVSLLIVVSQTGQELRWGWQWRGRDGSALASLLDQLIGTSFVEETFFRGFLLPQVFLRASRLWRKGLSLGVAFLISLALFVVSHVPRLLSEADLAGGSMTESLFWTVRFGSILTLTFLVTRNLFVCVGLHSLWNARPTLIEAPWQSIDRIWWALTFALLIGWWLAALARSRHPKVPSTR